MANEIELKLSLAPSAVARFLKLPMLRQAISRRESRLVNIYYDTPELDLHRQAIALRLRKDGRTWLQTVKCGGSSMAGLSSRPEWETPWRGDFDFSPVDAEAVRDWLEQPRIRPYLAPAFETNFRRRTWVFAPGGEAAGARLLLTLDEGWIEADGRRTPLCELEIELDGGDPNTLAALFMLAADIAAAVPVLPATISKAERGYRLAATAHASQAAPVHATLPVLTADLAPRSAFHRYALACLDHLQANAEGALNSDDPEYVHQLRVGCRRLRAALALFSPALPSALVARWRNELREIANALGAVRNRDVVANAIVAPAHDALAAHPAWASLIARSTADASAARQGLHDDRNARTLGLFLVTALADLHAPAFHELADDGHTLKRFVRPRLAALRRRAKRLATKARKHHPAAAPLHQLRVALKRLRYAGEAVPTLHALPLKTIVALQERLGHLNDLAMAGPLLLAQAGNDDALLDAIRQLGEWHRPQHDALHKGLKKSLRKLQRRLDD